MKAILLFFLCLITQVSFAQCEFTETRSYFGCEISGSPCFAPTITNQPVSATITFGENAQFTVTGSGSVAAAQWQELNNGSWINLSNGGVYSGVNSETLTLTNPSVSLSGRKYRIVIKGCGTEVISDGVATLTVNKASQTISWANPSNITFGTALGSEQLNATLTQGDGALTYNPGEGTILNVGQSILRVDAAATANFNAAFKEVTITVEEDSSLPFLPASLTSGTPGFQDYTIPADITSIILDVQGARGGNFLFKRFGSLDAASLISTGGLGGRISAQFPVDASCEQALKEGGILRLIVGQTPNDIVLTDNLPPNLFGETRYLGHGGGGGSAILYQAPGSTEWEALVVAGGGGGAATVWNGSFATRINGFPAIQETNGANTGGNTLGGKAGSLEFINTAGGGGGILGDGQFNSTSRSVGCGGGKGLDEGADGGVSLACEGGILGGAGFGAGGSGNRGGGGGGGGYSGGNGGASESGGYGAGSFTNSIAERASFQTGSGTNNGLITITTSTEVSGELGVITRPEKECAGSTDNLYSIAPVNDATSYEWSVTGEGWAVTAGGSTPSATIAIGSGVGTVSVTATNACGSNATSTTGEIIPSTAPVINEDPASLEISFGENASFSVEAIPGGPLSDEPEISSDGIFNLDLIRRKALSYQWQVDTNNDGSFDPINLTGMYEDTDNNRATLEIKEPSVLMNGYQYRVIVNGFCLSATSSAATLTVNKAEQVITWANPTNIFSGTALSAEQLNATLITGDGALTYSPAEGTVLDAGTRTLRVDAAETANFNSAFKEVSITVEDPISITKQPAELEIIYGEVLSFSVEATGTGLSYQWQEDSGDGFIDILADGGGVGGYSGVTSATLEYNTPIVSQTGIKYRVRVTDTNGQEVISEPAILTVNPKEITASIVAQDKTYDGNSDAVATGSVPAGDVIEGDEVFVTVTNAAFSEANAGLRTVTADVSIANPNYSLTLGTANVDAEIYAKELTASIVAQDKTYDGNTDAVATGSVPEENLIEGDEVIVTVTNAAFSEANAGLRTVTADVSITNTNYSLTSGTASDEAEIFAKELTASIVAQDKTYDGNTDAIATGSVPAEDLIEGDEVIVTVTNAAFANANAGTWTVSADVSIDNGNYSLTSGAASDEAEILPKELTASIVAEDKTYDGNTDAIATGSVPAGDVIEGDEVIVTVTNAAFSEANAGLRTVTADVSIANPNYSLTLGTANVDAEIYAKELTASIVAQDKTYDGNTDAVATGSVPEENLIEGDEVIVTVTNAAFANANAGTWTVSADVSIDNGNYSLTSGAASDEAEIFAKELTASIVAEDKTYDGNTDAVATGSVPEENLIEGDEVIVTVTNAAFSEANAGLRTVTADVSITNTNYSLTSGTASDEAEIFAKELTASIVAQDKTYDGNTDAIATGSVPAEDLIEGDEVIVTVTNAAFSEANAGLRTVTADVSIANPNYSLTSGTASDEAEIFAKELTASIVAQDKTYDGTTDAVATGSVPAEDLIEGDEVIVTVTNATFAGPDAGIQPVTADVSITNTNYSLTSAIAETTAEILPAPTTITVEDALANCDGDKITLNATVKTDNSDIQSEVDSKGGKVIFKVGDREIGSIDSSTDGIFSDEITIDLSLGAIYDITAKFIPNSGNLSGSQTDSKLTVFEAIITSSETPNENGNVVIFDGAASSLGLPSSATLTAAYEPSVNAEVNYQWYFKNEDDADFTIITDAKQATYTVNAMGDFIKEYKVEVSIGGQCVANTVFSKVVSVEASCGKEGQNKVQVCHVTPNGNRKTICVSANAVDALINGNPGSYIGNCNIFYRADQEPELITVAWNTPVELIKGEIVKQSEKWFNSKKINMNISTEAYNSLLPGMYTLTAELERNDFYELEEPIVINVLVLDKPMAQDITISNTQLAKDLQPGQVIGTLSTIDPIDDIHTYSLGENAQVELNGDQLVWKGSSIPAGFSVQVMSTDRAGQTISREIQLSREMEPNQFILYPNPAQSETNLMVDLDEGAAVEIRVFDAVGRMVIQDSIYREETFIQTLNLNGLAPGMYMVQVKIGYLVMTERLIKR